MPVTTPEVGGIVRVSTKRQAQEGESPANQRHLLEKQGATRFYEYVGSGFKLEKRRASPAWQALLQDIREGHIRRLLAVDISRAARKDELLTELIELCDASGVEFLASGYQLSHGNAMQWYSAKQLALVAELYSRDLSDKIKRGRQAALDRGVPAVTSKHLPWHLMREPGTRHGVIPHPDRWDDARAVVMDYIEGRERLDALAARIYKKHQIMGCAAAIHKWLRSHALLGHYGSRNGEIWLYNCFPALISDEEGQLLNLRLAANRKRWGTTSSHQVHALSGLCRCLHCGMAMSYTCVQRRDKQGVYKYLRCNGRRECPGYRQRSHADLVEEAVLYRINQELLAQTAAATKEPQALPPELLQLRKRISTMEQVLAMAESPGVRADLKQAYTRLEQMESALDRSALVRIDQDKLALMSSVNRFMQRPEGERNADLLSLIESVKVDSTYKPVGGGWQPKLVREVLLR